MGFIGFMRKKHTDAGIRSEVPDNFWFLLLFTKPATGLIRKSVYVNSGMQLLIHDLTSQRFNQIAVEIRAWMSYCIPYKTIDLGPFSVSCLE